MNIAITFTDQNPDGGAVIGKETYIVPVDEKYIPVSTYRTEPLCTPWEIESRLQSLLSSYGLRWFKSNVKIIVQFI